MSKPIKTPPPEQQRRVAPPYKPYPQKQPYDYYASHPEHRPRPLPGRLTRRRAIRES